MTLTNKKILILISLSLLVSGCIPSDVTSNTQIIPILKRNVTLNQNITQNIFNGSLWNISGSEVFYDGGNVSVGGGNLSVAGVIYADGSIVCTAANGECPGGGGAGVLPNSTNFLGSDCNGSSGSSMRVLPSGLVNVSLVAVDNFQLHVSSDYNLSNGNITFYNRLWDDMRITVWAGVSLNFENFFGSSASGADGSSGRTLVVTGSPTFVLVDNYMLHRNSDYSISGSTITFNNRLWDDMRITVWR